MKCEGCGEKDAEVECGDCAPKGTDVEPLLLCNDCCSRVHIGHGRLSKHRVIPLTYRKQQQELKRKYDECQALAGELKRRKQQVPFCRDDIDERIRIYERQIRESTMLICKKIKQRAITLIKKMKEALAKRSKDMDDFDRYLSDNIFSNLGKIKKELQGLEMEGVDEFQSKVQEIEAQIEAIDFSVLRDQLPNPCLPYAINFSGIQDDIKALDFAFDDVSEVEAITEEPKYATETLEEGTEMKVCVQSVVTRTGEFWLQPDFGAETYDKLLDISHKIRKDYICNLDWKVFQPQDENLQVGTLCCVLYSCDNKWYRGRIEELRPDKKSATIRYLDFGNSSIMALPNILPNKCFVQDVPFQAVECRLSGIPTELTHEAKWLFNDMVKDKLLNCKFLNKQVTGDGDSRDLWLVELFVVQDDTPPVNINEVIKERAGVGKASKEGIKCRDIRLTDENLASTFTVITTTVKARDSPERSPADSGETQISDKPDEEDSMPDKDKTKEDKDEPEADAVQDDVPKSQDIRNVIRDSQDVRNLLKDSQDGRNSARKSQDVRNVVHSSQDIRKTTSTRERESQDVRRSGEKKSEPLDECASFLSSIVLGGQEDKDDQGGLPVGVSLDSMAETWQDLQASSRPVEHSTTGEQPTQADSPIESDQLSEIPSENENTLPKSLVTEISIQPAIAVVGISGSDYGESGPTRFPIGGGFHAGGLSLKSKPPKHLEQFRTAREEMSLQRSLESEAQQVVANIIQDVVSHFCVNGKTSEEYVEVTEERCVEELTYGAESRGSDELAAEPTVCVTEDQEAQPCINDDDEQTQVKSILLEQNPQAIAYAKFARSLSSSDQENNVKNISASKPEIQDKSFSNLCEYDSDCTAVKAYASSPPDHSAANLADLNLCQGEIDQRHTNSLANNVEGDDRSMDVLDEVPSQAGPCEPHVEECVIVNDGMTDDDTKHVPSAGGNGQQEKHSLYSALPRISFVPGSTFPMYVVDDLQLDGSLCVQVARNDVEEILFSQFSNDLRLAAESSTAMPTLAPGELILAPFEDSWYRAEIESISADQVQVCFVDYGNTETIYISSIRPLPNELKYVPHQTNKCSLSSYNRPVFSAQECEAFNNLVDDQRLSATVTAPGYNRLHLSLAMPTLRGEKRDVLDMVEEIVRNQPADQADQTTDENRSHDLPYTDRQSQHRFVEANSKDVPKVTILQRNPPPGFRSTSPAGRGILQGDYPPINNFPSLPSGPMSFPMYFEQNPYIEQYQGEMLEQLQSQMLGQGQGHLANQAQGMLSRGHLRSQGPTRNPVPGHPMNHGQGLRADVNVRPMYPYPPPQLKQLRPRSVSPQPLTEQPPSQLREDATPFHPGSVYISPLKSQESLDDRINARSRSTWEDGNTGTHDPVETGGQVLVSIQPPEDRRCVDAGPVSLISEPSMATSSFFDEDAWVECESTKWPSLESLSNAKPPPPMPKNQAHKGSFKQQRRPKNRGDRDSRDYRRSGNSGDRETHDRGDRQDRGDRVGDRRRISNEGSAMTRGCFRCGNFGHQIKDCHIALPPGTTDSRSKPPRLQVRRV